MKFIRMQYVAHKMHVEIFKIEARLLDENGHNVLDSSYNNTSRYLNLVNVC